MPTTSPTRLYTNRWFAKFARQHGIGNEALRLAVEQAEAGLIDANLGSGVIKQRVARQGEGKSGGYRTILFFRQGEYAIFVFGFAKNDKASLTTTELAMYRKAAKIMFGLSQAQIDREVLAERLFEVNDDAADL
ncbi:type II toxin-antitoxin system RelE/ParE family toxin [Sandaracinobacteroides saxicola]|uniref:Type II toxin-antitoxin system RelE/ParE family toxin n=1 Tax=Sandaracinobacteroides saxicola TaxID=2759707 RepID=A0A7G5IHK1_9SPHN|nr:type II toxin-antitoxin system RelE/ParE family toxin [Sandaracinobacteroides saxicola]QMW22843.1 type II toxin-antitoxin system RelE/ParE family toxin [Sandaracinobacteroides saxicola]